MSKYTTELRHICEAMLDCDEPKGFEDIDFIIANARPKIFNFDYPIFDGEFKSVLETQIIKHYYTREICEETYGLWKLRLSQKLNDIMPYYNKLYETTLMEFNPLWETDLHRDYDKKIDGTGKSKNLYSDTPQGSIQDLESQSYLTNATITDGETNTIEGYLSHIYGRTQTNGSKLISEYRKTFLNINMMVVEELADLFFGLWE